MKPATNMNADLQGKTVLITGAVRRIGGHLSLALADAGANLVIHTSHIDEKAKEFVQEIKNRKNKVWLVESDFSYPEEAAKLVDRAWEFSKIDILINNAAVFEPLDINTTSVEAWQRHININLTAPFLLSQAFYQHVSPKGEGKIINLLDWRALRPGSDHLPYTISKAGLAALTQSLAVAMAPRVTVNGIALGAILPPSDGNQDPAILQSIPAKRWAKLDEVSDAVLFLCTASTYITGEIIHLDGGRHLV